jgi:hypothetical protein
LFSPQNFCNKLKMSCIAKDYPYDRWRWTKKMPPWPEKRDLDEIVHSYLGRNMVLGRLRPHGRRPWRLTVVGDQHWRERERDEEVEVPSPDGSSPFKGLKWKGASVVVPALTTRPAKPGWFNSPFDSSAATGCGGVK